MWFISWIAFLAGLLALLLGFPDLIRSYTSSRESIRKNRTMSATITAIGVALVVGAYAIEPVPQTPQPETTEQRDRSHSRGRAKVKAERYVRQHLSRPSTADFSGVFGTEIKHLDGGTYRVRGTVSAENAFGGSRELRYDVTLSDDGTRRWDLDEIRVE